MLYLSLILRNNILEKLLYIIRHGQTDLNKAGIVQGRGVNSPLNEMGVKQAKAFFDYYQHEGFDKIYTSTLLRTHQTVQPFVDAGIPAEALIGLDEIGWGIYEGQVQTPEIMTGFEALIKRWSEGDLDAAVDQGESPNTLMERQKEALSIILSREEERKVLICMHGRALRIFLCLLLGRSAAQMDQFPHTNTALYKVGWSNGSFTLLDSYNTLHLNGLSDE
jgi:probable phosphoglycerate mutase